MSANFTMAPNGVFESLTTKLCQLNQLTSFMNPWIVVPFASPVNSDFQPATNAMIYPALESLITLGMHRLAMPPWFFVLHLGAQHLWISIVTLNVFQALRRKEQRSLEVIVIAGVGKAVLPKGNNILSTMCLFPSFFTAAALNAALVLLVQTFQAPSRLGQHPNIRILEVSGVVFLLGCRFADWDIWRRTRRGVITLEWRSLLVPLYCQIGLFISRALLRWLFGLSPLLGLQIPSPAAADERFGLRRYGFPDLPKPPAWFLRTLSYIGPLIVSVLGFFSGCFLDRANRDVAREEIEAGLREKSLEQPGRSEVKQID